MKSRRLHQMVVVATLLALLNGCGTSTAVAPAGAQIVIFLDPTTAGDGTAYYQIIGGEAFFAFSRDTAADSARPSSINSSYIAYTSDFTGNTGTDYTLEIFWQPNGNPVKYYVNYMMIDDFEGGYYYIATPD